MLPEFLPGTLTKPANSQPKQFVSVTIKTAHQSEFLSSSIKLPKSSKGGRSEGSSDSRNESTHSGISE